MRVARPWTLLLLVGLSGCAAEIGSDPADTTSGPGMHTDQSSSPGQLDEVSGNGGKPQPDPWKPGDPGGQDDSTSAAPAPAPTGTDPSDPAPGSTGDGTSGDNGSASDSGGKPQPDPWRLTGGKPQPDPWSQANLGVGIAGANVEHH